MFCRLPSFSTASTHALFCFIAHCTKSSFTEDIYCIISIRKKTKILLISKLVGCLSGATFFFKKWKYQFFVLTPDCQLFYFVKAINVGNWLDNRPPTNV